MQKYQDFFSPSRVIRIFLLSKPIIVFTFTALLLLVCSCQTQTSQVIPTTIPTRQSTSTITSTPAPIELSVTELLSSCEQWSSEKRTVILEGMIFLPDETVTGYEIDGVKWLGMDLINTDKVKLLIRVGEGIATMNDLPVQFSEKDLVIQSASGSMVLNRHHIRVTGEAKYRKDKPEQSCEVFATGIESLEKPAILIPREITIEELLDNDDIDDCKMVEYANQLVRMRGWIMVNDDDTVCWYGRCRTPFSDGSGQMMVQLANGGGPNSIGGLESPYQIANVHLIDLNAGEADPTDVTFIGQITGISEYCLLTVYTILPTGSEQ